MNSNETITLPKAEYEAQLLKIATLEQKYSELERKYNELIRMIHGVKSERFIASASNQLMLFELPEQISKEPEKEQITYTREKPKTEKEHPVRTELPAHLRRMTEVIEPENLPANAKKIGVEVTETLEHVPSDLYVRRIERPKYIIETNDESTQIVIAQLPTLPIPKSNAGASMIAYLWISKYVDHLPYYRVIKILKRQHKIDIAESTLHGWSVAGCRQMEPLYYVLMDRILSGDYLMADETPIAVLTKDKPGSTHRGYYWVYYDPVNRLVLFDYRKTRSREGPNDILKNYSGHLQTDGYEVYSNLKNGANIQLLACMAHARRKFEHAKDNDPPRSQQALMLFQELYMIERQARDEKLSYDEIRDLRKKESVPVLTKLETWLRNEQYNVLPKSAIGLAINYTLNLWPRLIRYVEDGRFHIDNNLIENSIRPVAIGRKNYLFAGSHDAAQRAAMIYSFVITCKINNIDPYEWMKNTLSVIPDYKISQLPELIPGKS